MSHARWAARRLRDVAQLRVSNVDKHVKDGEIPVRLCNYVDVYKNERITERLSFMRATATRDELERFRLRCGDVLITKDSEIWTDIGVPALVEHEADDLVSGYHLALLRPRQSLSGAFLLRAFQSSDVAHQLHVAATGVTRYGLSHASIKSVILPVPPLADQAAIVRFLDHADRRIRRAIRAKQKLITLLNEQKQAVIHRAVTRGLDPNVGLKPSGVDWLGDVPDHWEIRRLRRVTLVRCDGPFGSGLTSAHYVDDGVRVVRLQNIGHAEFNGANRAFVSDEHYETLGDHGVNAGDVLVAGLGDSSHPAGRACVAPGDIQPAMVKADCFRFRLDTGQADPLFVALQLTATAVDASAVLGSGATRQRINLQSASSRPLAMPRLAEQRRIAEFASTRSDQVLQAASAIEAELNLLREYRIRLITDVVAGKLEVREAATKLEGDVDASEAEELDEAVNEPDLDEEEAAEV